MYIIIRYLQLIFSYLSYQLVYDHNGRDANVNNREKGQVQLEVEFL